MKKDIGLIIFLVLSVFAKANTPDEDNDDFIKASLVVVEPGYVLYSRVGHSFIRMECPSKQLDYCFSYESEGVKKKILTFLSGNLKMGMVVIPTTDFIENYRNAGRGMMQYELNLSHTQKQHLWEVLDKKFLEGMELPYDYSLRGCASSCVHIVNEALSPNAHISYPFWPDYFSMTRRELIHRQLDNHPWTSLVICCLAGTEGEKQVSNEEKLITPSDLITVWQHATLDGHPLLSSEGEVLVPYNSNLQQGGRFPSPMVCSITLLALTLVGILCKWRFLDYLLLGIQTIIGLFLTYLIVFSTLPCTNWNWLIVPFNPLPITFWKWRKKWLIAYSVLLVAWMVIMIASPHRIVDTPYLVFTFSLFIMFINSLLRK